MDIIFFQLHVGQMRGPTYRISDKDQDFTRFFAQQGVKKGVRLIEARTRIKTWLEFGPNSMIG